MEVKFFQVLKYYDINEGVSNQGMNTRKRNYGFFGEQNSVYTSESRNFSRGWNFFVSKGKFIHGVLGFFSQKTLEIEKISKKRALTPKTPLERIISFL